jgi:hypothetical protein
MVSTSKGGIYHWDTNIDIQRKSGDDRVSEIGNGGHGAMVHITLSMVLNGGSGGKKWCIPRVAVILS